MCVQVLTKSGVYLIGVESSGSPGQKQLQHNPILSSYRFCFEISEFFKDFQKYDFNSSLWSHNESLKIFESDGKGV